MREAFIADTILGDDRELASNTATPSSRNIGLLLIMMYAANTLRQQGYTQEPENSPVHESANFFENEDCRSDQRASLDQLVVCLPILYALHVLSTFKFDRHKRMWHLTNTPVTSAAQALKYISSSNKSMHSYFSANIPEKRFIRAGVPHAMYAVFTYLRAFGNAQSKCNKPSSFTTYFAANPSWKTHDDGQVSLSGSTWVSS